MQEELFMDVFDENDEFGIHLHMANECLILLDVDEFKKNGFGIWMSFLHVFVVNNNQHDSNQTACFISGSCRMFS